MPILVAFPVDPDKRKALVEMTGKPVPTYEDATESPCAGCGETLLVGPRVRAAMITMPLYCPWCAITVIKAEGGIVALAHLGGK